MKNEVFYLPRLADLYRQAERRSIPACSLFLSEAEQQETVRFCRTEKIPPPFFWGGHVDAERKMACFLPADTELDAFKNSAPIAAVYAKASESGLSHRDYLGALLGLGIARAPPSAISMYGLTRRGFFYLNRWRLLCWRK